MIEKNTFNIAVVEDNGMARLNLRNHLQEMEFSQVHCFSHGRELKIDLKQREYDLILMDFHLGNNKNGVEVIQELLHERLLKASTCLIFITSDRLPMIIGQIVDIHPDDLVVKPYTIKSLGRSINNALTIHQHLKPVLELMDNGNYEPALIELDGIIRSQVLKKSRTHLLKLRARLLIKLSRYQEAITLYQSVLASSDKVIWAKWGLIQCQFLAGHGEISEKMLRDLVGTHLTNDKACEWLASIAIGNRQYVKAEEYIEKINESTLSVTASKLKAYLYRTMEKPDEAIDFLERKRQASREIKEKYSEFSLELARCYLALAETKPETDRKNTLQVARNLIGSAGRRSSDELTLLKQKILQAEAAMLEDDLVKAQELLLNAMDADYEQADIGTVSDAVKAWHGLGEECRAAELLYKCELKADDSEDLTERTVADIIIAHIEESVGERRPRAVKFNEQGLELHSNKQFNESVDYFYQAYILFPKEAAFGLNLLQGLIDAGLSQHKKAVTLEIFDEFKGRELSEANQQRLIAISRKIEQDGEAFRTF